MKKIKRLDFGSIVFDVEEVDKLLDDGGAKKLSGRINYNDCRIEIEKGMNPQTQTLTLLHEIFHFLLWRSGTDSNKAIMNPEFEETFIDNLSEGMLLVLRKNPNLMKSIVELEND